MTREKSGPPSSLDKAVAILQQRAGKDKTIKIIQYTGRLVLRISELDQMRGSELATFYAPRIAPLVKELSGFRKVIKLGDWIKDLREPIVAGRAFTWIDLVEIYTGLMDDLYLLAKIGVLNKKLTSRFEKQAAIAWFISIVYNLNAKRVNGRLPLTLDVKKLLMDFIFCFIDVWQPDVDSSWQTVTGLMSAIFAYRKIWLKS